MKDAEATLLAIPGVTEAQVFAKLLVRCEFPMADDTIIALQEAQDWIEHETGWKVEMTISAGKRPEPVSVMDIVFGDGAVCEGKRTADNEGTKEEDPLWARVAAWEKEHPGKSYWDGAMAASGPER